MENILTKFNLKDITHDDLNEIANYISSCIPNEECTELFNRYNRLFDIIRRHIDGIEYNHNLQDSGQA